VLAARDRILQEERKRERVLKIWSISKYGTLAGINRFFSSQDDLEKNDDKPDDKE
jgi:hypothetical protein